MKNFEKKARAYTLKNALAHEGKAQVGSVIPALFHDGLKKSEVKKYLKKISEIVKQVNKLKLFDQEKEFEKLKKLRASKYKKIRSDHEICSICIRSYAHWTCNNFLLVFLICKKIWWKVLYQNRRYKSRECLPSRLQND